MLAVGADGVVRIFFSFVFYFSFSLGDGTPVTQWINIWPTDLVVPSLSPT